MVVYESCLKRFVVFGFCHSVYLFALLLGAWIISQHCNFSCILVIGHALSFTGLKLFIEFIISTSSESWIF